MNHSELWSKSHVCQNKAKSMCKCAKRSPWYITRTFYSQALTNLKTFRRIQHENTVQNDENRKHVTSQRIALGHNQQLVGQVFVAAKKWKNCMYFQQKLHLCAVSCIYAHVWLLKTWHDLFSFARTWPKAKIFRTSTLIKFGQCRAWLGL